jgi:hypothetical protein
LGYEAPDGRTVSVDRRRLGLLGEALFDPALVGNTRSMIERPPGVRLQASPG